MKRVTILLALTLVLSIVCNGQAPIKIGYLADKEYSGLTLEERFAFDWLKKNYPGAEIITFSSIDKGAKLSKFNLIWWHYNEALKLPYACRTDNVKKAITEYAKSGKGLLLTLLAAQYTIDLNLESVPPNKVLKGGWEIKDTYKEIKGFHSFTGHPLFNGLFDGAYTWNTKQNFDFAAAYYDSLMPAKGKVIGIGWDYITFKKNERHVIEYETGKGKCLAIGSYIYFADEKNVYRKHLEKLISNSFEYLNKNKTAQKESYWKFDPLNFEIVKGETGSKKEVTGSRKADLNYTSGLEIKRDSANSKSYFGVSGLRSTIMGKENGGVDEVWVHPLRAFQNYQVFLVKGGKEIPLSSVNPKITVRPESFIRNYKIEGNIITETLFASRNLPSGIINYKIESKEPAGLKIKFDVDNRIMWPYDEDFLGTYMVNENKENNKIIIHSRDNSLSSIFGMDKKSILSVKVEDTKVKTKIARLEFAVEIKAGENDLNFVFSSSNESLAATEKYYRKTINGISSAYKENVDYYKNLFAEKTIIESPDKEFNDAYKWALAGVDKFFIYTYPLGSSFMAGMGTTERGWDGAQKINGRPGYAWYFGRDSEWTSFAVLDYGDYQKVKAVLEFLGKYQDLTGKIFHELTSSNAVHYDAADATPLYVILMGKYLNATGDTEFIKQEWPKIQKAIDFCYSTDTDKDGLIENTNVGHGWVEGGKIYGAHVTFYLAGLWASTLEYGSRIAKTLNQNDLAESYDSSYKKVLAIIDKDFWNSDTKFYNDGKNIDGTFSTTKTIQVTVPMYFNTTDEVKSKESIKEFLGNDYTTNWGARIIGESNPMFNPRGYHYGTVWPLFTGWAALADYKYGYSLQGFSLAMNNLMVYKNWGLGYIEEVLHGTEYKPAGVCSHQAWSESMALQPLLEGMVGISPDKLKNELRISPQIPPHFNKLNVSNILFGKARLDMNYSSEAGVLSYKLKTKSRQPFNLVLSPKLARGAVVKKVILDGKEIEYKTTGERIEVRFNFTAKSELRIETAGGISINPVIQNSIENEKPYGVRIIDENYSDNSYKVTLEGVQGSSEKITLTTPQKIKKISGGIIISQSDGNVIIEVKFPKSKKNYVISHLDIEL